MESAGALVVADLHFGYELSQQSAGQLFPDWGRETVVERVEGLVRDWLPDRLVLLGDLVHSRAGWGPLTEWLGGLGMEVVAIRGNHDRGAPPELSLRDVWYLGGWRMYHGDRELDPAAGYRDMIGHWHPGVVLMDGAGLRCRIPALIVGEERVVLPAFSPWAGGNSKSLPLQEGDRVWALTPGAIAPWPR